VRVALVAAALCGVPHPAAATTYVNGTMNTNATWTTAGSPYVVTSTFSVGSSATLTIQPGVVIKVNGTFTQFGVVGSLVAVGTADNRIVFTSLRDDSIAGDTGGDGPTTGAPGQWYSMYVQGSAVLQYVDVRYGGWGSANTAYGGIQISGTGNVNADQCHIHLNQRAGIAVGWGGTLTLTHSNVSVNAIGVSAMNAHVQISANSSLSSNSDSGVYFNYSTAYVGAAPSIMNSDVANNTGWGIKLVVDQTISSATAPTGHENNIFNNGVGADQRQLFTLHLLTQSDWKRNYWGPVYDKVACLWAPPDTPGFHLAYGVQVTNCADPVAGPVTWNTYMIPSFNACPNDGPFKCASDWVNDDEFSSIPFDNSAK
jgi:hypothetical protein